MNPTLLTLAKLAAAVVLLLIIVHFWPWLGAAFTLSLVFLSAVGFALALGITVLVAIGFALIVALTVGLIALGVSLAPVWVPILAIIGLVALFRSGRSSAA
ncbi:MAG TPA: hypothetical protein VHF69_14555 [Candidatus Synoicihabitans sp.]|nr:hypothetical protein [Candidatus Synoicihabitans sp.]